MPCWGGYDEKIFGHLLHDFDSLMTKMMCEIYSKTKCQFTAVISEATAATEANSSRRSDEVSIAQRLSETGRATRSKLLKIARKLDWRRSSASG